MEKKKAAAKTACRFFGGPTWDRTKDRPVMSRGLYR